MQKLRPFVDCNDDEFFDCTLGQFFLRVREEFYGDFDQLEGHLAGMYFTGRGLIEDPEMHFYSGATKVSIDDADDTGSGSASGTRPSTSSRRTYANNCLTTSARGSVDQAARSTPNLNLNSPPTSGRFSDQHSLSPLPHVGAFSSYEGYHPPAFNSAPASGGPSTPVGTGNRTPTHVNYTSPALQHQQHSQWASFRFGPGREPLPTTPGYVESDGRRDRGHEAISRVHSQHDYSGATLTADSEDNRYSGIFHSALPADLDEDDEVLGLNGPPPAQAGANNEPRVLFVVASLFEFHIDSNRREAGYPYLKYLAGEVFDILGQRGELWLARNQDDAEGTLGWIWEKHFALLPMDTQ